MKIKIGKINFFLPKVLIIIFFGFLLRIILCPFLTLKLDQNTFIAWSINLVNKGFNNFYHGWSDYFPGYLYILWLLGKIRGFLPDELLYKIPAIVSDLLTGYLIYQIAKKYVNKKKSLIVTSLYVFNPAVISNSTLWGQIDSIVILFSLLALFLIEKNIILSAVFLSLGTLVKPQVVFLTPLILYLLFKSKNKFRKIVIYAFIGAVVFLLGFLPFLLEENNLFQFIFDRILLSFNQYQYTSVNAFNFWGLFGFWKSDIGKVPLSVLGTTIFSLTFLYSLLKTKVKKGEKYVLSTLIFLSSFLFLTRIHERHLLPVFAPLVLTTIFLPNTIIIYVLLSFTYIANMLYSYVWITYDFQEIFPKFLIYFFSVINLWSVFFFLKEIISKKAKDYLSLFRNIWEQIKKTKVKVRKDTFPIIILKKKYTRIILFGILLFSLVTRLYALNFPDKEYFDEVYHAFTAKEMLHGNKAPWEWWNTPPEGFAYEWTHPPLAKLFMWGSMTFFKENSFFWRLPGAILGSGVVFLVYLISKKLFKDEILALISAAFFSLDGLALTMSRIGMNDTYLLFFSLLTVYLFSREKDFLSSISFGLALSSKWSALWVIPIIFILWLSRRKKFDLKLGWFLVIPPLVYLANYIPMFLTGHSLDIFWGMQKQMWWYHTRLEATHPYTSYWWSWPLNVRPVYLFTSDEIGGMVSRIYNLGNPVVFWFGLVSVISSFIFSLVNRNKKLALVVFSYLVFFVPWAASPRIMFFYHYLPSLPFLAIATGYVLRKEKRLIAPVLLTAFLMFIYFYPHWIGIRIPLWLDKSYYWFSSWR
ncbi:MAG: glycosyltransferase family 39 protein [Patescibacteria group bacterium]